MVNDTSSKQYDDFNKNLKNEFGKNLEQIQTILNDLRTELDQSHEKQGEMERVINSVDVEGQKRLDKVRDQIEIERVVNEMVSWVAEEKSLAKFGEVDGFIVRRGAENQESKKMANAAIDATKKLEEQRLKDREADEKRREEDEKRRKDEEERRRKEEDERRKRDDDKPDKKPDRKPSEERKSDDGKPSSKGSGKD